MGDMTMMVSLKMLNWTPIPSKFPFNGSSASFNSSAEKYTEWGSRSQACSQLLALSTFQRQRCRRTIDSHTASTSQIFGGFPAVSTLP